MFKQFVMKKLRSGKGIALDVQQMMPASAGAAGSVQCDAGDESCPNPKTNKNNKTML